MRKVLLPLAILLGLCAQASAQNYNATAGAGLTFGAKLVSTVLYPQQMMCDPTTPANCVAVNASGQITLAPNQSVNNAQWAGGTLGAMANYGTSPGAVLVPGVNAFITNTPSVAQSGTWTIQPGNTANTTPWLASISQGGSTAVVKAANTVASTDVGLVVAVANTNTNITPGDAVATGTYAGASPVIGATLLWNGTTYDRWKSVATGIAAVGGTGTAGTPATNVLTVQGIASMTPFLSNPGTAANWGIGATASAVPANAGYVGFNSGGNLTGVSSSAPLPVRAGDGTRQAVLDPCEANAQVSAPISITTATTTRIVTPSASNKTYICGLTVVTAAANNVGIVEGTGGTCGTGTAGVIGGTTAANGPNFGANSGIALQAGKTAHAYTAGTNVDLCLITSAATPLAGVIKYVQAP